MGITRQNYEVVFMDYLDGKLGDEEIHALMAFLDQHPDLKQELNEFSQLELVPEIVPFRGKELLKKDITEKGPVKSENFAEFSIAYYEGSLNERLRNELQEFVFLHPEFEKDFMLFSRVYVKPDLSVQFPWKNRLRKGRVLILSPRLIQTLALAASLALLAGIYFLFPGREIRPVNTAGISTGEVPLPYDLTGRNENNTSDGNPSLAVSGIHKSPQGVIREKHTAAVTEPNSLVENPADLRLSPAIPLQAGNLYAGSPVPDIRPNQAVFEGMSRKTYRPDPVLTLPEYAKKEFRERVLDEALQVRDQKVSAWDVAGFGIKAFNKITGSEVRFSKEYSHEGELIAVVIDSKNFGLSRTLKNN
ncbi:MAG: hypothetical protein U0T82_08005 [Bacteroidales bacterium]